MHLYFCQQTYIVKVVVLYVKLYMPWGTTVLGRHKSQITLGMKRPLRCSAQLIPPQAQIWLVCFEYIYIEFTPKHSTADARIQKYGQRRCPLGKQVDNRGWRAGWTCVYPWQNRLNRGQGIFHFASSEVSVAHKKSASFKDGGNRNCSASLR